MKNKILFNVLITLTLFICCKPKQAEAPAVTPQNIEHPDANGPEFTSRYICPMHCKGSGSDTTGVCPVCGMDYELNTEHK